MPTGYTVGVADGKVADFRTFALRCARAFGATAMQRDDPLTDPPKHREPSAYNAQALAAAQAEVVRLASMGADEARAEMESERAEIEASNERRRASTAVQRARYEAMLSEVSAWNPPTADHAELKTFMADQLTASIDSDCREWVRTFDYRTPEHWLEAKRAQALQDVTYYTKADAEEIERCATANAWIDALYASLTA